MKKRLFLIISLLIIMVFALLGGACTKRPDNAGSSSSVVNTSASSSKAETNSSTLHNTSSSSLTEQTGVSSETSVVTTNSSTSSLNTTISSSSSGNSGGQVTKFLLNYVTLQGMGTAPNAEEYFVGDTIILADNPFVLEGQLFVGWNYGGEIYSAGAEFIMPNNAVTFTAVWEIKPAFSQLRYEYDCLGGGDLELPLVLGNAIIRYVEIDGNLLDNSKFSYNPSKNVLVIDKMTIISLSRNEHTVLVVSDKQVDLSCTLEVSQSLKTTFDSETVKSFTYMVDSGVSFSVGYNGTTPTALYQGEKLLDGNYYTYDDSSFTLKSEWLSYFCEPTEYKLVLSNNDVYSFKVNTNMLFATDYDVVTMHDTTVSTIGHNPLYQYSPNVSIVEKDGMSGNVLKITPNTVDVTYDCNGYITLGIPSWDSTWKKVDVKADKYYYISFDYMTENTSSGEFSVKSVSSTWSKSLYMGSDYDGIKKHFSTVISTADFGNGIMIWAKFIGGGGNVYIDNYKLAELNELPESITNTKLTTTSATYTFETKQDIVLNGHFEDGVTLVSLRQIDKAYDNGYTGGWDFIHNNANKNYASFATLVNGLNGEGKLILTSTLLDMLWGDTSFIAEFSDGAQVQFTISSDVDMYTDYDNTTIWGYLNGVKRSESPLSNGFGENGAVVSIEDKGDGNKALFLRSTEGARTDASVGLMTVQFHTHVWNWYNVSGNANYKYRLTFNYKISNLAQDSVYFYIMALAGEDVNANFFGNYDQIDVSGDGSYYMVRYNLIADGQEHTFDSGEFTFNAGLRMMKIQLPTFTTADNAYVMIDEYRVTHSALSSNAALTQTSANFVYGSNNDVTLNGDIGSGLIVTSVKKYGSYLETNGYNYDTSGVSGQEISLDMVSITTSGITVKNALLNTLYGTTRFVVGLSDGSKLEFNIVSNVTLFSDWDNTSILPPSGALNAYNSQDTSSALVIEDSGNKYLKYDTTTATGLASNTQWNWTMLFETGWVAGMTAYNNLNLDATKQYKIEFDYKVVGEGNEYFFLTAKSDNDFDNTSNRLSGEGKFEITLSSDSLIGRIGIGSTVIGGVSGSYLLIDNYRIVEVAN